MTVTIHRSTLVVVVAVLVIAAGMFVSQRASAASATPVVYVATGENFPDALGAASAAAVQGGPVLLVRQNSIPEATKGELSRLKPDVIYVAGGSDGVSDGVFNALKAYAATVVRVEGRTRYETAVEVSKSAFPVTGGGGSTAALEARIAQLEAILAGVTRNGDTLLFTGMNVQLVNGAGSTRSMNGLGNLIIGYNEDRNEVAARTGSHYLVVGDDHDWTSWVGIVAGIGHTVSGIYSSAIGGAENTASGNFSSVTGGFHNVASGVQFSSVIGGRSNHATGVYSSVTGGKYNVASGDSSSATGGHSNTASGDASSVTGGRDNVASGQYSYVTGGTNNNAAGRLDGVLGGDDIFCDDAKDLACAEGTVWDPDA